MPGPTSTPSSRNAVIQKSADDFVSKVAAATGLDPNVIRAWVKVEGAYAPNGTGHFNFLNLRAHGGTGYSGVPTSTSPGGFAQFATVDDAAKETAYWLNTMPNYAGIRQAVSLGPRSQLAAIAASPWDAGHYQGGRALTNAYTTKPPTNWFSKVVGALGPGGPTIPEIASKVGGAITGPLDRVVPGLKTADTVLTQTSNLFEFAFNPHNWLRIGYILGGGLLAFGGLLLMAKSVGALNVTGVAAPELNLASKAQKNADSSPYKTSREGIGNEGRTLSEPSEPRRPSRRKGSASRTRTDDAIPF